MKQNKLFAMRFISFICTVLLLTSCNDIFLEVPLSELSTTNFYQTEQDAVMAVNACYNALPMTRDYHILTEPTADQLTIKNQESQNFQTGAYNSQTVNISNLWNDTYKLIYRCNTVIERIPPMNISEDSKNEIVGEAKFLRAFGYFTLVRLWGDVPMLTTSVKDVNNISYPKNPALTIYNELIIPDLEFAILHLNQNLSVNDGRASKDAARGILANVYLTLAGNDNSKQDYWKAARDTAYNIILNRGGLSVDAIRTQLCYPYGNLFKKEYKNHPENIFAFQCLALSGFGTELTTFYAASGDYCGADWIGNRWLSTVFYNSFEKIYDTNKNLIGRDDRLNTAVHRLFTATEFGIQHQMFWPGNDNAVRSTTNYNAAVVTYKNFWGEAPPTGYEYAGPLASSNGGNRNYNRCWVSKYDDPLSSLKADGGANIPLLRYSEVLLIFAEAENEINPSSANALIALNAVRERAKLPAKTTLSQTDFREAVLSERNFEFFAENKRYFDLIRRGRYVTTMNKLFPNSRKDPQYQLFPIPFNELQTNTKLTLTDQNPGW